MAKRPAAFQKRLNLKLIVIVFTVVVLLFGTLGWLWYYAGRSRPARYEARGNGAVQRGRYEEALDNYKRSISMTRGTVGQIRLLKKMISAATQIEVSSEAKAHEYVRDVISYQGALAALEPGNTEYARQFLVPYFQLVRESGNAESWNQFRTTVGKMVTGAPGNAVLRKYDGIANVVWMLQAAPEEKKRLEIGDSLMKARDMLPDDGQVAFYLACWCMNEAKLRRDSADQTRRERLLENAQQVMEGHVEKHPTDLDARLDCVRVLLDIASVGGAHTPEVTAHAGKLLAELEQQLLGGARPDLALDIAKILQAGAGKWEAASNGRAITFLRQVLQVHPDQQGAQFELGVLCRLVGDRDAAVAAFVEAAKKRQPMINIVIMKQQGIRIAALRELAGLYIDQCEQALSDGDKADRIGKAEECLAVFRTLAKNDTVTLGVLEARLAIVGDKQWEALEKLGKAIDSPVRNPEALFWQGFVLARQGECGEALRCFRDVFAGEGVSVELRLRTAREMVPLLVLLKRFDDAATLAGNLARNNPDDPSSSISTSSSLPSSESCNSSSCP